MKKSSDKENIRNQIIGLGSNSVRKNYYKVLMEKQKDLEEKNKELEEEIKKRMAIEKDLVAFNEQLEITIKERTNELEISNQSLKASLNELEQTHKNLIRIEKIASLSSLIRGIAHEINTPIGTSVMTLSYAKEKTENLLEDFPRNSTLKSIYDAENLALQSLLRAVELIDNYKKISTDQKNLKLVPFKFYEYMDMVINTMPILSNTNAKIHIYGDHHLIIKGYPGVLSQILTSFISNSIEHGQKEELHIDIFFNIYQGGVEFIYQDNGKGCDPETLKRIFDPFFSTATMNEHSGLGLYAVHNIVTNILKGSIQASLRDNKGMRFIIFAPAPDEKA